MNSIRRVMVLQPHGLGDMLMTTPMLGAIKATYPEVQLTVICGSKTTADVLQAMPFEAEALVFDSSRSTMRDFWQLVMEVRRRRPDAFLVNPWVTPWKGELVAWLSGARWRVGATRRLPFLAYTQVVPKARRVQKIQGHLLLARQLFPGLREGPMVYPVPPEARVLARQLWRQFGFEGRPVLGLHPGGDHRNPNKIYPFWRYLQIMERFQATYPEAGCLIFLGPSEADLAERIPRNRSRVKVVLNLSLPVIAALLEKVQVLLHSDSGLGHLAVAVRTPVLGIFGPASPAIAAPRQGLVRVVTLTHRLPCQPCVYTSRYARCRRNSCLQDLFPEVVLTALKKVWQETAREPEMEIHFSRSYQTLSQ